MKPGAIYPSAFCLDGCGRQRQHGKEGRCCRCWREANGLPPTWSRRRGAVASAPVAPVEAVPVVGESRSNRCRHCRERWPQQYGLCRTCAGVLALAAGYASVRQYLEADHLAREAAKMSAERPVLVPLPSRTVVADGVEYDAYSLSVRTLKDGELEREIAAARNPIGWVGDGSPWSRTMKR